MRKVFSSIPHVFINTKIQDNACSLQNYLKLKHSTFGVVSKVAEKEIYLK